MDKEIAISLQNIGKTFSINSTRSNTVKGWLKESLFNRGRKIRFKALNNINLEIYKGETFGIIGGNGSGKSTLTKIMSGAYLPDKGGYVKKNGKSILMSLNVGMSGELTARQNILVIGSALGLKLKDIENKTEDIIKFAELEDFADVVIRHFSNGMKQRLSFATAINAGADIIFLDEVFAVGDQKFKNNAIKILEENWLNNRTVVMVSHSLGNIKKYCNRAAYLKNGEMKFIGDPHTAIKMYQDENSN